MSENNYEYAIGRRKTSVVTLRLFNKPGRSTVNGKPVEDLYMDKNQQASLYEPFVAVNLDKERFFFTVVAKGGGKMSQLDAIKLALSRAIIKSNPSLKKQLKNHKLLTRDPRMVERKKPGLHKARKAEQYSKR